MFRITFTMPGSSSPTTRSWMSHDDVTRVVRELLRDGALSISVTRE